MLRFPGVQSLPVPVGQCHHDVKWCQEEHEMEERVGIGDTIPLVVHSSIKSIAFLKAVRLRPILNKSWLVTRQSQLVHLGIRGITNADRQQGEKREHTHSNVSWLSEPQYDQKVVILLVTNLMLKEKIQCLHRYKGDFLTWNRGHTWGTGSALQSPGHPTTGPHDSDLQE